jgi:hypothetical protein
MTYVSINKEFINFQHCFVVLSQLCHGRVRRYFLISNVSASNITLCSGQYVAGEEQFEQAWLRLKVHIPHFLGSLAL